MPTMRISLSEVGKRFNRDWIFRNLSREFNTGGAYAITGPNGSGKSTLMQIIAGAIDPSEGKAVYEINGKAIENHHAYRHLSMAAPYQELIEEMTLTEFLRFHSKFKSFLPGIGIPEIIDSMGLEKAAGRQIRYYSSGMKQRVKLAQAVFSDTACVLLDEPCTNFDEEGISWYHKLIYQFCNNRLVVVSSNDRQEYGFCDELIEMGGAGSGTTSGLR